MVDFNPDNYPDSITIGPTLTGTSGTLPACSACLFEMFGAGGGGGGAPPVTSGLANATGGGGGGGGTYGLIAVTDPTLLLGTTQYVAYVNFGGIGQYAGAPSYDGQDGNPTTLSFPALQTEIQVSGGQGGSGGQVGPAGGQGGNGGVGAVITSSSSGTTYFQIGSAISFGGGGGVNIAPGNSIYGATGGIGYLNNIPGGAGYNGNNGNGPNNTANPSNTRAGYGGGSKGSRGGSCRFNADNIGYYLSGAGSGGSVAKDSEPAVGIANCVHPYTNPGAGAGFNSSQEAANPGNPGAMGGGGGGGGAGELSVYNEFGANTYNGAIATNGGNGLITILYKP